MVYLDQNLFEDQILQMLYYNRNDINKGKDPIKSNKQVIKLKIT